MLLYINGQLADLDSNQVIAQTKQVNDLNSLDNRQTNYTNKFKLPKTANNIRIMGYLTLAGNNSDIPYQKNECSLYSDNGECFVHNGWAVISDGGDTYEAVIYDGIIDLYKAIEGKNMNNLDLSLLDHEKNVNTVTLSWSPNINWKFKYILADYNGKTKGIANISGVSIPAINIDYLVPSVKVDWLWHKILTENGFGYNGSVFASEDFTNLWITYPKGVATVESEELLLNSTNYTLIGQQIPYTSIRKFMAKFNSTETLSDTLVTTDNIHLKVPETGSYKLEISGKVNSKKRRYDQYNNLLESLPADYKIFLGKNAQNKTAPTIVPFEIIKESIASNANFSKTLFFNLNEGDAICLVIGAQKDEDSWVFGSDSHTLNVKLSKVEMGTFDFNAAFSDFSMRDFLNEIVYRYGLTMYKDPYSNTYTFLTLKELLQDSPVVDWSTKFIKKTSENYNYANYAQQNWLRYNYNEKENAYNDGYIAVMNKNLPETRDAIKSKIYSPEKSPVNLLNRKTNVYKLWEKEAVENPESGEEKITYKPLDKRYYLMRSEVKTGLRTITSELMQESSVYNKIPVETFTGLSFKDIVNTYYEPFQQILDKACIVTADMFLKDTDMINFDFRKRYFIEQLGATFIVNKITNYVPGKPAKCELIKVKDNIFEPFSIKITRVVVTAYTIKVYYTTSDPVTGVIVDYDPGGEAWISLPYSGTSPATFNLPQGAYKLQLRANGKLSNNVSITVPDIKTINIP